MPGAIPSSPIGVNLTKMTPIILFRKLACERLLFSDGPLSIRSQASFLQRKRLRLTPMRHRGTKTQPTHRFTLQRIIFYTDIFMFYINNIYLLR